MPLYSDELSVASTEDAMWITRWLLKSDIKLFTIETKTEQGDAYLFSVPRTTRAESGVSPLVQEARELGMRVTWGLRIHDGNTDLTIPVRNIETNTLRIMALDIILDKISAIQNGEIDTAVANRNGSDAEAFVLRAAMKQVTQDLEQRRRWLQDL